MLHRRYLVKVEKETRLSIMNIREVLPVDG